MNYLDVLAYVVYLDMLAYAYFSNIYLSVLIHPSIGNTHSHSVGSVNCVTRLVFFFILATLS